MTSLEGSSSRGGASRKTITGRESGQNVAGKRKNAFGQNLRWKHGGESAKDPKKRARIKDSRYGYN